jgi:Arc/MetJ-type ribon-helix-helix transcriptional regulator
MGLRSKSAGKTTIKIPKPLYQRLSLLIEGAGYNSVTDFIVYVLRDLAGERELEGQATPAAEGEAEAAGPMLREERGLRGNRRPMTEAEVRLFHASWRRELERAKQKLKSLGYL